MIMVFENQLDLILQNAVLSSRLQGANFQSLLNDILGSDKTWTDNTAEKLKTQCQKLGINDYTIFQEDGAVLLSVKSGIPLARLPAKIDELKAINTALARKAFENLSFSEEIHPQSRILELWIPFHLEADRQGVAALTTPLSEIQRRMDLLYRQIAVIAIVLLLIQVVYAFLTYRQIFVPLRILQESARAIAEGNLNVQVPMIRRNEIGELANAFNEMSVAIRNMREEALGANPLSGLPGNHAITKAIEDRLSSSGTFAVLYSDLDNFKAYNDKYGFSRGDEAILFVKECLLETEASLSEAHCFVGHEGGDDFVITLDYEYWRDFCVGFLARFDGGVARFYNPGDVSNGYIESYNRQGAPMRFPIMSVSIAIVSNRYRIYQHHGELVQAAAEVKKMAKQIPGSSFIEDQRSDRS